MWVSVVLGMKPEHMARGSGVAGHEFEVGGLPETLSVGLREEAPSQDPGFVSIWTQCKIKL